MSREPVKSTHQDRSEHLTNPFDDDYKEDVNAEGASNGNGNGNGNGIRWEPRVDSTSAHDFTPEDERRQKFRTRQGRSAPLVFSNSFQDDRTSPATTTGIADAFASRSPQKNLYESGTITSSEMSPLLPDDLSRGYQSASSFSPSLRSGRTRRRKITVPTRIFTGQPAEASPYSLRRKFPLSSSEQRRTNRHRRGGHRQSDVVMTELAHADDHDNGQHQHQHPEQVQMEYKYILLEDLGTASSWVILVLPYATFFFSVVLLYFISVPVASMGSMVTALRMSCFLVTFVFILFWIRQMQMLRLCCGGSYTNSPRRMSDGMRRCLFWHSEKEGKQADENSEEMYWWENPWVLFPERYYVLPLLSSSLLVLEPILVLIYFVPTLGTPTWYTVAYASSGAGIQACSFIYLCLIEGFRYHTGERSKRRAELQRKALQLRKAVKFVDDCKDEHKAFVSSPKVVQKYYDEYGDIDGSGFTVHLRLPNDPRADGWADFLLPKILLLAVGIASAIMISLSMTPIDEAGPGSDDGFVAKGTLFVVGSIVFAITLCLWTFLTIAALYTTGEKLKREPFLGTRPAQLAYRILFAHSGLAIVGLGIASMQYMDQIRKALQNESIAAIIEQEHSSLVYPGYISFPGMFGRLVCLTAQVAITAFIFLPPHTMDFEEVSDDEENELTELQMLNKNRRDKRLVVRLAKESKTWRIFPCPIQKDDETSSPFQDNMFQVYKDMHTDRDTHQRGLVSVGPYIPVFCAETACWLNEASSQAYYSPAESSGRKDFGNGFDKDDFLGWMRLDLIGLQLEGYVYDERTNTLAYIATNSAPQIDGEEDTIIVVAFRGTSDATNVKTDFRVRQVPLHDQITGIGESAFRVFPDRFEICDEDGWIWDTKISESDDHKEFVKCVGCWTEATPPCTPTYTAAAAAPFEGRRRTYSVGGFDGVISKETADILKDAPLARNSFPMVHEGFQDAYSEIRKELFELLLPVLQRQLAKSVESSAASRSGSARTAANEPMALPKTYCTGHSLGGSLAQLFALDLATNCEIVLPVHQSQPPSPRSSSPFGNPRQLGRFFPKTPTPSTRPPRELRLQPPIGVYTYGQPRVGNRAFSRFYKQRVPHSFRVVNEGDAITTIPNYFWCGGLYKHAGLEVILDAGMTGNVLVGPTVVETLFRFHKVRTNIMAHQMERYRECLECIFDSGQLLEYYRNHNISGEELRQLSGSSDNKDQRRGRGRQHRSTGGGGARNDGPDWDGDHHGSQRGIAQTDGLDWHDDRHWKQGGATEIDGVNWYS